MLADLRRLPLNMTSEPAAPTGGVTDSDDESLLSRWGAVDTFLLDRIIQGWKPHQFVDRLRPLIKP